MSSAHRIQTQRIAAVALVLGVASAALADTSAPETSVVFIGDLDAEPAEPAPPGGVVDSELPEPGGQSRSPLASTLLDSNRFIRVTQALELIPNPTTGTVPRSVGAPTLAPPDAFHAEGASVLEETVAEPVAVEASSGLTRPMYTLTLDSATEPELERRKAELSGDFAIRDESQAVFGSWDAPVMEATLASSRFAATAYHWAAPAFYSRPLYFEQPNLERYGHHVAVCEKDHLTQSAVSAAHFFVTVPALPYLMGADLPGDCNYVLGSYRPGSCNPHQLVRPEPSLRGLVFEGAAATGLVFLIP